MDYDEQRKHELRPLADALALMVRGIGEVTISDTGGRVYCASGRIGAWTLDANEDGWALTDDEGYSVAVGVWFAPDMPDGVHVAPDAYGPLTLDPDTGALVPEECEAAALNFASVLVTMLRAGA